MTAVVNQLLDDQTPRDVGEDDVSDHDEDLPPDEEPGSSVLAFDIIRGENNLTITDINMADNPKAQPVWNYSLRIKGPVLEQSFEEKKRAFLRKILPPGNEQQAAPEKPTNNNTQENQKSKLSVGSPKATTKPSPHSDSGYNIVEDMKKTRANISLYELARITNQWELILKAFAHTSTTNHGKF